MIMVLVLGAGLSHAGQPAHVHGAADEAVLVAQDEAIQSDLHTEQDKLQNEPTFHCGAPFLGIACEHVAERYFGRLPYASIQVRILTVRPTPLDPRPPRA